MARGTHYQIITLGPGCSLNIDAFRAELSERLAEIDLKIDDDVILVDSARDADLLNSSVAVWFGVKDCVSEPTELEFLEQIQRCAITVLPIVEKLAEFTACVPDSLLPINAVQWNAVEVVATVLRLLRLTRQTRRVFISYKRSDAGAAALQLFNGLCGRGFLPFLDTASIEGGTLFQQKLWGRMADVDLLVFFDTPNALGSDWVRQELMRAQELGLGVLQLVWPEHARTIDTELSDCFHLDGHDFNDDRYDSSSTLESGTLTSVLRRVEQARIRSLGALRRRLVNKMRSEATERGLDLHLQPSGRIDICLAGNTAPIAWFVPYLGLPDAEGLHRIHAQFEPADWSTGRVVYESLGMDPDWGIHLEWLNRYLDVTTEGLTHAEAWIGGLS